MRKLLVCLLWLCLASTATARDWYVDNVAGDDRNLGFSPGSAVALEGPVQTIAKALRHAEYSDRIILANTGEPYRESITLCGHHRGTKELPFRLIGNGATLDGQQAVDDDAWEFAGGELFQFQPRRLSAAQQLFYEGRPLVKAKGVTADGRLLPVAEMQWRYLDQQLQFRPEKGRLPQGYQLTYAALPVGITLYQVEHVEIEDLIVQGYQLDGINAHDSAFHVKLTSVTARGNGRSGISIGGASRATLEACLVGSNGQAQVRTEGWSHTELVNCNLIGKTAPAIEKTEYSKVKETTVE